MHRACLADEAGAKRVHHAGSLHHRAMKACDILPIVLRVRTVLLERRRIFNLARHGPDLHVDAKSAQPPHEFSVEIGHRHRTERENLHAAVAGRNAKLMGEEIEIDVEGAARIRIRRRNEAARVHVERDIPPVIHRRREFESHLAGHLRPKLQGVAGGAPGGERQIRPRFWSRHVRSSIEAAMRKVLARLRGEENAASGRLRMTDGNRSAWS